MARSSVILGRRNCSKCKRWRHIVDFPCQRRKPFKLQSQCKMCARQLTREWYERNPGKRAEHTRRWREQHLEEDRVKGREYMAERRKNPKTKAKVRRQARKSWRRARKDPKRWEARLAQQRANYERRKQDPEWVARQQQLRHAYYDQHGGREEAQAKRAREKLRRQLAGYLVLALRQELERREAIARAERRHRYEIKQAWAARRREMWERGDFDEMEPVVVAVGGVQEVRRLPVAPLARWMKRQGLTSDQLALQVKMDPRALRRYTTGESLTVDLGIVDEIVTRLGVMMLDIYDPGRYPVLYEAPEEQVSLDDPEPSEALEEYRPIRGRRRRSRRVLSPG